MKRLKWHTEKRKVNELLPYEGNPRQMTEKQKKDLEKSLKKFDLVEIPAIDTDNKIIAGHQRIKIMQMLGKGEETIDVRVPNRKLTEEEFKEYNLRSNKNVGEWDWDMLANYDERILEDVGFDEKELKKITGQDDITEEEPEVEFTEELKEEHNYIVLYFDNEVDWLQALSLFDLKTVMALNSKKGFIRSGLGRVIKGATAIQKLKERLK